MHLPTTSVFELFSAFYSRSYVMQSRYAGTGIERKSQQHMHGHVLSTTFCFTNLFTFQCFYGMQLREWPSLLRLLRSLPFQIWLSFPTSKHTNRANFSGNHFKQHPCHTVACTTGMHHQRVSWSNTNFFYTTMQHTKLYRRSQCCTAYIIALQH